MAVQAQYPSTTLPPAFQSRILSIDNQGLVPAAAALQEPQSPLAAAANLFRASYGGLNFVQQPLFSGGAVFIGKDSRLHSNLSGPRKRSRHIKDVPTTRVSKSTGLDDAGMDTSSAFSPESVTVASLVASVLSENFQSCMSSQRKEMEQFIKIEEERVKQSLEEMANRHARAFLSAIEQTVAERLKWKEDEFQSATRRNAELQKRVKQLSRESQLWQNAAWNSELMASSLKNSLEQVLAQSRDQTKEGCGESDVDDAGSCQVGEGSDLHSRVIKENKEQKERQACRVCRTNNVCILLLPCRHLCLCKDCERRQDACPVCEKFKTATIQVHLS